MDHIRNDRNKAYLSFMKKSIMFNDLKIVLCSFEHGFITYVWHDDLICPVSGVCIS